ncbi:MAG: MFS transporter [Deltaproteobacteria bacterium]|nr:MFS transporter [Deltaproteobacteria bacterium]
MSHEPPFTGGPVEKPRHSPEFRRRRLLNWFPLGLMYAAYYMTRYNLSVANPYITSEFGWTKAEFGAVISACLIVYGLSVFLNGPMADRIGGRKAILIGAVGAFVANLAFGAGIFTRFLTYFIVIGMVNYYFQTFGALSVVKVNAAWFHRTERGVFAGLFGGMIQFGRILAISGGGFIVALLPWQWVFWIPAIVVGLNFLFSYVYVRNTPEELGFPRVDEKLANEGDSEAKPTVGSLLQTLFASPTLVVIAMAMMCTGVIRHSLEQWGPAYFLEVQRVQPDSAIFQIAFWGQIVMAIFGATVLGYLSDKYFQSRRGPVTAVAYGMQALLLLAFGLLRPGPWAAIVLLMVIYFFLNGCHGLLAGTASMDFGGRKAAASAAGMLDGSQYFAGAAVGLGMGALLDRYGWNIWAYTVVPLAIIGGALMASRWRTLPRKAGEAVDAKGDDLGTIFACMFLPPFAIFMILACSKERRQAVIWAAAKGIVASVALAFGVLATVKWVVPAVVPEQKKVVKKVAYEPKGEAALAGQASVAALSLALDLAPDPITRAATATGTRAARDLVPAAGDPKLADQYQRCKGFVGARPDFVVEVQRRYDALRFYVAAMGDTTLLVRGPAGSEKQIVRCVDDTGLAGKNPIVGGAFEPGVYEVWVGTRASGTPIPYTLGVTARSQTVIPRL